MKLFKKIRKGFTLIELVVVIAIIAILAAVSIVSYISITNKAKESNDHMVIDQVNTLVQGTSYQSRKATVHDLVEELVKEDGFDMREIKPELKDTEFVYCYEENMFGYWKNDKVVYPETLVKKFENRSFKTNDIWKFEKDPNLEGGVVSFGDNYSHYIKSLKEGTTSISVKGGLDVGNCSVSSINFSRSSSEGHAEKDVVIRTNGGELVVNAPNDTVHHYGKVNVVDIQAVGHSSYYEKGTTTFAKIKTGRLVVTEDAEVGGIHAVATVDDVDKYFDNIKIAVVGNAEMPELSRDAASIDEKTGEGEYSQYVLEVQTIATEKAIDEAPEYVWANISIAGAVKTPSTAVSKVEMTEEAKSSKVVKETATEVSEGISQVAEKVASDTQETKTEEQASENAAGEVAPMGVARIGINGYPTLDEALSALLDGQTVVLLADIERDTEITFTEGNKTLDLNGHQLLATLPANRNAIKVNAGCEFTLKDSSEEKSGKIVANRSAAGKVCALSVSGIANIYGGDLYGYYCLDMGDDSIVNLFGGVLSCDSGNAPVNIGGQNTALNISGGIINSNYRYAIASNDKATINISGGAINLSYSTNVKAAIKITNDSSLTLSGDATITAPRLIEFANTTANTQVSILGGNYSASIELHKGGDWSDNRDKATVTINGGTFNIEPSISCFKSGSTIGNVTDNGDGTWTVSAD